MPNWCMNTLTASGPDVDKFLEWVKLVPGDDPGDVGALPRDSALSFERIIPTPERYKDKQPIPNQQTLAIKRSIQDSIAIHMNLLKRPPINEEEEAEDTWYEWRVRNWGTKWDVEAEVTSRTDDSVVLTFDTAWSPPIPIVNRLSEVFPELTFHLTYDEPGNDFSGTLTVRNGFTLDESEGPSVWREEYNEDEESGNP